MSKARVATFLTVVASVISFSGAASAKNYIIWLGGDCSHQWENKAEPLYADQYIDGDVVGYHCATDPNCLGVPPTDHPVMNTPPICGYPTNPAINTVNNNCPNTGWINHDAAIDSTQDPFSSVAQLVNVLNSHCAAGPGTPAYSYTAYYPAGSCKTQNCGKLGCFCTEKYTVNTPYTVNVPAVYPDTCVIVSHSGSDNVVRLLLASYPGDDLWNIRKVYTTSGAGGGSELIAAMGNAEVNAGAFLSDTDTPDTCDFTWWMDVDTSRNGYGLGRWAWDDTSGTGIHHLMEGFSYSGGLDSNWVDDFFPGTNDHGIALHSGLGRADVGYYLLYSDQGPNGNYYGHSLVHIVDYDYYLEPLPYDGHETATQLSPTGSQFVPQSDHFYSKRDWFMYFIGANADLECHGLYPNNPEYCTVSSSSGGGPSWLDTFLNSLVSDGVCLFGCSGYY